MRSAKGGHLVSGLDAGGFATALTGYLICFFIGVYQRRGLVLFRVFGAAGLGEAA